MLVTMKRQDSKFLENSLNLLVNITFVEVIQYYVSLSINDIM